MVQVRLRQVNLRIAVNYLNLLDNSEQAISIPYAISRMAQDLLAKTKVVMA